MIPYGRQSISEEDVEAVSDILRSDWLTQGPTVTTFEQAVATTVRAKYAIAANSATSALHMACQALDMGPGDVLWTVPNTFVASANCARYCGALVDFVDIDPVTRNISLSALETKLQQAAKTGRLPKVIVPVHFSGRSCDMAAIAELARPHGIAIIEDASHAIGGFYAGEPIGCCRYSDITVFSFHPVKIVTSGEGGVAVTNSTALATKLKLAVSHGITRSPELMQNPSEGPWYYEQISLGENYRLTDIQAALGLSQMSRLHGFVQRRQALAQRYDRLLAGLPLELSQPDSPGSHSAWHLYVVRLTGSDTEVRTRRRAVFDRLRSEGIGVNVHYIPVHLQPYYRALGFKPGDFPAAENYYDGALTLPLYASLSEEQQDYVVDRLRQSII
ncbi:UDP-4-amino-4,6-dideoxy-N-acetyl-beta-L-altrosamine transaminase [Radicibacter daui]|uniref:UDP-4-amino-4, 6-dideoxy-N-acetyl-beta-L-altrosamine transaminase n=1 Tax=Radicibacter daui TaxID=3064829 RepID=UPI004046DAD4